MPAALLDQVLRLCREAGDTILEIYQREAGIAVDTKPDQSPVTAADLAANAILEAGLQPLLKGVPVLSEEGVIPAFSTRASWQRYWLIDPLDGTREFLQRNGEFTVNVALIDSGKPVLGVVHAPVAGISYSGVEQEGAFKYENGARVAIHTRALDNRLPQQGFKVFVSRRHGSDAADLLLHRLASRLGPLTRKTMGSSLKLCLVAEGEADLYPRLAPTSEWDTAAAQAIVTAAGGKVLDEQLRELRYNQKESLLNPFFYVVGDPHFDWATLLAPQQFRRQ